MSRSGIPSESGHKSATPQIHNVVSDLNTEAKCIVDLLTPADGHLISLDVIRAQMDAMRALDLGVGRSPVQLYDLVKSMGRTVLDFREPTLCRKARGDEILVRNRPGPALSSNRALAGLFLDCSVQSGVAIRTVLGERKATPEIEITDAMQARLVILDSLLQVHEQSDCQPFKKSEVTRLTQRRLDVNRLLPPAHMRRLVKVGILENVDEQAKVVRFADDLKGANPADVVTNIVDAVHGIQSGSVPHIERGLLRGKQIIQQPDSVRILMARSLESSGHTGKTRSKTKAS